MNRRKGEQRLPKMLVQWSDHHPVAQAIGSGDYWFDAWVNQQCTPLGRLAGITGIPILRLLAIARKDAVTQTEIEALARAWCVSASDLLKSIDGATEVVA